jgi:hypothetical protein
MISPAIGAIGLGFFFYLVLYFCVLAPRQDMDVPPDAHIDIMRKSPLGRWRY